MSKPICYLCASDEGILLDIFGDAGKTFRENIETCLSVKVKQGDGRCTKICHKCAYELESCSRFLDKYRRSKDSERAAARPKQEYCSLCTVTADKVHLLRINGGNSLKNSLRKIGQVIEEDLFKDKVAGFAVCLDCRYNVDLLFDLRSIYEETPEKLKSLDENGLDASDLPKTRTSVALRNTTYVPLPRLNGDRDSNASTSSSGTMSLKRKRGRPHKESVGAAGAASAVSLQFRSCEQCDTQVEHGIDMYRYHRTGLTVCKDCWLTMDPERVSGGKRKRLAQLDPEGGTKLCAVFLKDVLTNPSKYENIYKLEKDKHGNTTFLITDESSENEEKTPPRRTRGRPPTSGLATHEVAEGKKAAKRPSIVKRNEDEIPKRARAATRRSNEPPESPPIAKAKAKNGMAEVDSTPMTTTRARARRGSVEPPKVASASPESRGSGGGGGGKKPAPKKAGRPPKIVSAKKASSSDEKSQARTESSPNAAQSEIDTPRITRARKTSTPEQPTKRASRRTRSNSFTDPATTEPLATRRLVALAEEPSEESSIVVDAAAPKISKTRPKIAKSDSELEKPYTCSVCQAGYANKLVGKAHELTHEKQPEVKLRRVVVPPETIAEETPPEASKEKSEVANEPRIADGNVEERSEKPSDEKETARPVTPHIAEKKHDPEETRDASKLALNNKKNVKDSNEKDERDDSDETEVSLALRDTSDDEPARIEEDAKKMNGDENEAPGDGNEGESEKKNVKENREKNARTKDDVDESPSVTELREVEDACAKTCDESKKVEGSKPDAASNATPAEDIEQEATESSQATLPDKVEPEDDENVENCAAETGPSVDDESDKDVEDDVRKIESDSEKNLRSAVPAKPEVCELVDDCTMTTETATDRTEEDAQSGGEVDDRPVEEEKMEEKKTEQEQEEERKETEEGEENEKVEEAKKKSKENEMPEEQEKENDARKNEKDKDTEEREVKKGEKENAEVGEENEKEEGKKSEKKKGAEESEEAEDKDGKKRKRVTEEKGRKKVTEENKKKRVTEEKKKKKVTEEKEMKKRTEEKEMKKVTEEKEMKKVTEEKEMKKVTEEKEMKKVTEEKKRKKITDEKEEEEKEEEEEEDEEETEKEEDEEEKIEEDEEEKKNEDEEEKKKEDEEEKEKEDDEENEKKEDDEEKHSEERKGNGKADEDTENVEKEKEEDTEKERKEETENKTEKANNGNKDKEEAETTVQKDEEKEDELLGIEPREETTDETEGMINKKVESVGVATEVLREVFDLASAEVKKRLEKENSLEDNGATPETLENISLEIQNSADPLVSERSASNDKS